MALREHSVMTNKKMAPSFIERVMAVHTVTTGDGDMAGTVIKSDSDTTNYKLQPTSKSIITLASDTRSKIERAFADVSVLTKTDVERMVENRLTKWTNSVKWQTFKAVESTFENAYN